MNDHNTVIWDAEVWRGITVATVLGMAAGFWFARLLVHLGIG